MGGLKEISGALSTDFIYLTHSSWVGGSKLAMPREAQGQSLAQCCVLGDHCLCVVKIYDRKSISK